jgi:hypothetical protein
MTREDLEGLAAKVTAERWSARARKYTDAVDLVDGRGQYVAVGVPGDVARAVLALPSLVAELRERGGVRRGE